MSKSAEIVGQEKLQGYRGWFPSVLLTLRCREDCVWEPPFAVTRSRLVDDPAISSPRVSGASTTTRSAPTSRITRSRRALVQPFDQVALLASAGCPNDRALRGGRGSAARFPV